ncbi:MAG: hypothetical protein GY851_24425 [bacterium]|nr:hypothetical protein [bacterium]
MALFNRKQNQGAAPPPANATPQADAQQLMAREAHCRECDADRTFSRVWLRVNRMRKCLCCGMDFPNPAALYAKRMPACPKCEEYLEAPGFEYGLCDTCGSKFELMTGTKPVLLPNKKQRAKINAVGRSRSVD